MKSDMIKNLEERSLSLRKAVDKAKRCLGKAPEGHLQYSTSKRTNTIQYFHRTDPKSTHGKYIPVSKRKLAVSLAQKDYMKRLLPVAQKEQTLIENLLSFYNSTMTMEELYKSLPEPCRRLVTPVEPSEDEYIQTWYAVEYEHKEFCEDAPEYYAANGVRMRSKSELLIADCLLRLNVPFRYECPLTLEGCGTIHPDFTVLNVSQRKTLYWEHLGMMDVPEYAESAVSRIGHYIRNNIIPGDELILTYETKAIPLHTLQAEKLIKHYLF